MNEPARVGVRLCKAQSHMDGFLRLLRIERLPGIGERALAEMRLEACGNVGHCDAHVLMRQRIQRELKANFTAYKVLNGICADV